MKNQRELNKNIRQVFLGDFKLFQKSSTSEQKKKPSFFIPLILGTAAVTVFITTFWIIPQADTHQPQAQAGFLEAIVEVEDKDKESIALPIKLTIESINVTADIETVGYTPDGAMDTPNRIENIGWFEAGPLPGEMGSAVLSGHLNGENNEPGVFNKLHLLKVGDEVSISDESGVVRTFIVMKTKIYDWSADVPEVFYSTDGIYVNLITCIGSWNSLEDIFEQRLVVFTQLK